MAQLPIAERAAFEANAFSDYADVAVVNLLASVLKASELLNGLAEDFKLFNQGNMKFMEGAGYDPTDMFLGDDEGNMFMGRSHHPDRQPKGGAGLFNKLFK